MKNTYCIKVLLFCIFIFFTVNAEFIGITKLIDNGPDSNRVVIVILGDGYVATEQAKYNSISDTLVANFFKHEPWKEYKSFINVYRINLASLQSGVDSDNVDIVTDIDGQIKVGAFVSSIKTEKVINDVINKWDCAIAILNTTKDDGSGLVKIAVITASTDITNSALHEIGHSFAGLADEYAYGGSGGTPTSVSEPNVAVPPDTARSGTHAVKWAKWLTPDIPMPTPNDLQLRGGIGLFIGAKYSDGAYRPEFSCMMSVADGAYCRICTEAIVLKIHETAKSIDNASPKAGLVFYNFYDTRFDISIIDTTNIKYKINWELDYTPIINEYSNSITLDPYNLAQEPHILRAIVTDTTRYGYVFYNPMTYYGEGAPFVRNDPKGFMSDTVTWYLQYKLDGPNSFAVINNNITVSASGHNINIKDQNPWELYSNRSISIYNIHGKLLKTIPSNGISTHKWVAPTTGVFFIAVNNNKQIDKNIVKKIVVW